MTKLNYQRITDRYHQPLKEPDEKPTLAQAAYAWALVNELLEVGYPPDPEGDPRKTYPYQMLRIVDKARKIKHFAGGNL